MSGTDVRWTGDRLRRRIALRVRRAIDRRLVAEEADAFRRGEAMAAERVRSAGGESGEEDRHDRRGE